ncbi:NAD(P)-dependent alcohol dehydrogenase [Quadrisphaera sp. DSM 44207]|uniref:NAD(P)-dependent alcohol dehydrogenase n=1 Tax=Quadrisphaera sp. DSM 44207 TaxID=1881057 RepID=UPI000B88C34F
MRRAQYDRYGPPEVLRVAEVPVPVPGPGEVLVRVHATSVNGGELLARSGRLRWVTRGPFPRGTGVDFAGEVAHVDGSPTGPGDLAVGDRVWGVLPRRQYASGRAGAAAEHVAVPAGHVAPSPAGLDLVRAAALPVVGTTAITALRDQVRLQPGERLLVRGASGGVGSVAVQLGRALGARVTGLASRRHLDLVRELGAEEALDRAQVAPDDLGTFDVVLDTAGSDLAAYRRLLGPRGRMVTITPDFTHLAASAGYLAGSVVFGSRRVRFFTGTPTRPLLAALTAHVEAGEVRPVVDTVHPLAGIAGAHRAAGAGGSRGKHVVRLV